MNIKQVKNEIKHTVKAYLSKNEFGEYMISSVNQRPLLLIGPPGIGKTQIMEQICQECKIGLVSYTITHHTRQSAVGLPFISQANFGGKEYSVTEYTMSEIIASVYKKMEETGLKEGILFIDEINCVSETLAPTMLQFLQNKTFGNQAVPAGWIIVAAGNPAEYNKSVREFDMVTLDRIRYMSVDADYYVWKEYAINKGIHPMILSYLELKPNHFYRIETTIDGMQFVTARGWEDVSNILYAYERMGLVADEATFYQYLHHSEISEDVAAYYLLYKKYEDDYGILDILRGKYSQVVYQRLFVANFDERVSFVNLLISAILKSLQDYYNHKLVCDTWYAFLKLYRSKLDMDFQLVLDEFETSYLNQKRAGLLQVSSIHAYEDVIQRNRKIIVDASLSQQARFEFVKVEFDEYVSGLQELEDLNINAIKNAFEFMEGAFESGQEMTIFVTNLTLSNESSLFLSDHFIELYEKYKKALLIGTKKAELLDELNH